jgi:hypothetical protein
MLVVLMPMPRERNHFEPPRLAKLRGMVFPQNAKRETDWASVRQQLLHCGKITVAGSSDTEGR